jgi:Flp pilus assembly protein TadG
MKLNWKDESGQALVLTVVSMTLFFGFLALAVDVGLLFRAKRNAQMTADSAAIAGAMQMAYGSKTCVTGACAANAAALLNGYPSSEVTVTPSPTDGYHTGSGYVKVVVHHANPTFFIGAFYGNPTSFTVSARAVAGTPASPACMHILDPSDPDTLYIKGKGQVNAPGCGIQVDSKDPNATCNQGAAKINAPYLHIVGGQDTKGPCKKTPNTQVVTNVQPTGDPLNNFTGPTKLADCTVTNTTVTSGKGTKRDPFQTDISGAIASPGAGNTLCYQNQVNIAGGSTLGPGTYVFFNGVTLNGTVSLTNGTLDIAQGTFTQNNAQLSITAPTSGTYSGIAIMQPSTNTTASSCDTAQTCLQVQFGSGNENLTGLIYAPASEIYMQDEGGGVQVAGIIAYQLYVNSDLILTENYNQANSSSPLNQVTLVE